MGAKNKGVGRPIMDDWLLHCRELSKQEGWCDYETAGRKFEQILTQHTGQTIDEWEAEYKDWILGLPVEQIGKTRGNSWSSEPLKLTIEKPSGWNWVKASELANDEVVAAKGSGRSLRRVSTYCWPNWQHAKMNAEYASRLASNIFQDMTIDGEYQPGEIGGFPVIRVKFTGKRVLKAETTIDDQGRPTSNVEVGEPEQYEAVFIGSVDKIYCNVFECSPEIWEDNYRHFEKYLEEFHTGN
jgi:hypothetical protein